ncbi:MAG: ABC transporter substrate-binding protein [Chloroflexota bacterium]
MRKYNILFSLLIILSMVLAACGGAPAAAPAEEAAPAAEEAADDSADDGEAAADDGGDMAMEAPALAEMVAAGDLPPLEERLPAEPFVVGPGVLLSEEDLPDWEPGQYGGTVRTAHFRPDWNPDTFVMMNEPLLSSPGLSVSDIRGNVLKDFEVNEDNTEFTFHMREGLKWSDGVPVTTEDVRFVYEDIYLNEQLTPTFPRRFRTGYSNEGSPMTLEVIDDFTFKVMFDEPYGGFLRNITIEGWNGYTVLLRASHHLKQWHPDYTSMEEIQPLLDEAGLTDEWWTYFSDNDCLNWHVTRPRCVGFPQLNPWLAQESDEPGLILMERNPYYYKVDTEGKQLPYVDRIVSTLVNDVEAVNLKVLAGEVDFLRESTGLVKIPLYKENEEAGGFTTVLLDMHVDSSSIWINQTFEDEDWQAVAQDVRFRQAVTYALDRDEMIDSLYFGFAGIPMLTVGEEQSARDLDRANALLDELGLTERDDSGMRMYPSGNSMSILLEHGAHAPDLGPAAELVGEQLREVGLDVQVKQIDSSLWGQRNGANELQMSVFWAHDQGWDSNWTSETTGRSGPLWNKYVSSGGEEGVEPPAWVTESFELDKTRWGVVSGSDEYNQLKEDGYAWHRDNLPEITIVEDVKYPMIAAANLGNVAIGGYAIAQNFAGEQIFFKSE